MIIWLTGNSLSGKTTIGKPLAERNGGILLDGDRMRSTISLGAGFSPEEREGHNLRVARLAGELERQGFLVVVAVISPFEGTRQKVDKMICPIWIYLKSERSRATEERPYEPPANVTLTINTDAMSPLEAIRLIEDAVINGL